MTASTAPDSAKALAASGSSNAPGTHTSVMSSSSTLHSARPRRAPSRRRSVTWSLKRAHTTATRSPLPSSAGRSRWDDTTSRAIVGVSVRRVDGVEVLEAADVAVEPAEQVTHALALRAQVVLVVRVGLDLQGHPLDDLDAEAVEPAELRRVVRHQPHRRDAEVGEDLRTDAVLAAVGRQPKLQVGVDGVVTLVLQAVGADLVTDADAATLVAAEVHDAAHAFLGDHLERGRELRTAIAAQRPEHVAGEALAVHAHEHVLLALHVAAHEGEVLIAVEHRLERDAAELAEFGGDRRFGQ